jgi:hypothetical protein
MGIIERDGLLIANILFVFSWRCGWLLVWVLSFVFAVGSVLGGWGRGGLSLESRMGLAIEYQEFTKRFVAHVGF